MTTLVDTPTCSGLTGRSAESILAEIHATLATEPPTLAQGMESIARIATYGERLIEIGRRDANSKLTDFGAVLSATAGVNKPKTLSNARAQLKLLKNVMQPTPPAPRAPAPVTPSPSATGSIRLEPAVRQPVKARLAAFRTLRAAASPATTPARIEIPPTPPTDQELYATYSTLTGPTRKAFLDLHRDALWRGMMAAASRPRR